MSSPVNILTEGHIDVNVAKKMLKATSLLVGDGYSKNGKQGFKNGLPGYNKAAQHISFPCFALCDLDQDYGCAPQAVSAYLRFPPSEFMVFRLAVRSIEAWLMADRWAFASFLGVSANKVPPYPDQEQQPKRKVINLARRSSNKDIRLALVPVQGTGASQGPEYTDFMTKFVNQKWDPERASNNSDSLKKSLLRLQEFRALLKVS